MGRGELGFGTCHRPFLHVHLTRQSMTRSVSALGNERASDDGAKETGTEQARFFCSNLWSVRTADCKVSRGKRDGNDVQRIRGISAHEQQGGARGRVNAQIITIHPASAPSIILNPHRKINLAVSGFVVADASEPAQPRELNGIGRRSGATDGLHNGGLEEEVRDMIHVAPMSAPGPIAQRR